MPTNGKRLQSGFYGGVHRLVRETYRVSLLTTGQVNKLESEAIRTFCSMRPTFQLEKVSIYYLGKAVPCCR